MKWRDTIDADCTARTSYRIPPAIIKSAIDRLRIYAADDPLDRQRLEPLFEAYHLCQDQKFLELCRSILPHYCACHIAIDELCDFAVKMKPQQSVSKS